VKQYDHGATTNAYCENISRTDLPPTISCSTQVGPFSIQLSVWTTEDTPTQPTSTISASSPYSVTGSPTTSSSIALSPGSGTITTSSVSSSIQINQTVGTSPGQTSAAAETDRLGMGAEIGSILGAIFGAAAVFIALWYGHRQLKQWRSLRT
jgi:hypothetical protein